MLKKDFSERLFVGITGNKEIHWKSKLREVKKFDISVVSLFLERFEEAQRKKIYKALLKSEILKIPLVHIRDDMKKKELKFLSKNFGSSYFTIHENHFKVLERWRGFHDKLFLEMDNDGSVSSDVDVDKIGGFCIDLSHFKESQVLQNEEDEYVNKRRDFPEYFACNHLNGYSPKGNIDMHTIEDLENFEYLKSLPKFLFGKVIALEMDNSISEQLKFISYLSNLLNKLALKE